MDMRRATFFLVLLVVSLFWCCDVSAVNNDLSVMSVKVVVENGAGESLKYCKIGVPVDVVIEVKNNGADAQWAEPPITLYDNGRLVESKMLRGGIPSNEKKELRFNLSRGFGEIGKHEVEIVLDPNNHLNEDNKSNNRMRQFVIVRSFERCQIRAGDVNIRKNYQSASTDRPVFGQSYAIDFKVVNESDINVSVLAEISVGGISLERGMINNIRPGQTGELQLRTPYQFEQLGASYAVRGIIHEIYDEMGHPIPKTDCEGVWESVKQVSVVAPLPPKKLFQNNNLKKKGNKK
ncbi:MAG: CARDB domain-containing protein [Candidatus Omnitrophota bacterium]